MHVDSELGVTPPLDDGPLIQGFPCGPVFHLGPVSGAEEEAPQAGNGTQETQPREQGSHLRLGEAPALPEVAASRFRFTSSRSAAFTLTVPALPPSALTSPSSTLTRVQR